MSSTMIVLVMVSINKFIKLVIWLECPLNIANEMIVIYGYNIHTMCKLQTRTYYANGKEQQYT